MIKNVVGRMLTESSFILSISVETDFIFKLDWGETGICALLMKESSNKLTDTKNFADKLKSNWF